MTLPRRGRRLFKGGADDEAIPSPLPSFSIDDDADQDKPNAVRLGPITRSRAKLLEQQVNSLLTEYDVCVNENFILPKSMHLCMIRFVDNTNIKGGMERIDKDGKHEGGEGGSGAIKDRNFGSDCQKS